MAILIPNCVGFISALPQISNTDRKTWYQRLDKAPWNPPSWVFGPAWTILYTMMGVSSWLVWRDRTAGSARVNALIIYAVQLLINFMFTPVFFGLRKLGISLVIVLALWFMVIGMMASFAQVSPLACWLLVPYILWVTYALSLNIWIWAKNPEPNRSD